MSDKKLLEENIEKNIKCIKMTHRKYCRMLLFISDFTEEVE